MKETFTKAGRHIDQISADKVLLTKEQDKINEYRKSLDMNNLENRQAEFIYDFMINTGLREGELVTFRLKDCPLYQGTEVILVHRGKGNRDRTIHISPRLCKKLQDYIEEVRPKTKPRWVKKEDIKSYVFYDFDRKSFVRICKVKKKVKNKKTGEIKEIIKQQIRAKYSLYKMIREIGTEAGLTKRLHPHMLRHTYATNAIRENKISTRMLMAEMGHANIEMTERYINAASIEMPGLGEALDNG